ncbi:GGDEF domain-containing protein [Psychrobium sp. 1_MG-2023]|uniref:GGDEF domain-containing protein n=1 Tax=Psychrobium sp. 1_MG-2023 TaxID=3062624 RepID=UPI000C34265D|nr:GGDEF domain-containing protein [Psychrobium sp. 1_MG-2023]MDP2559555.1 GGDEF domain-containing protein [Psychrobium sp. 1_MG-2023]PKF59393.1 GGDEF domain-containing protein [Alteromonadales bacterium alter-6D02]
MSIDDTVVFDDSVATLKKTIPLMMKYNVPVIPVNYALWYTYASNQIPNLNKELDSAIQLYKTCPSYRAEQLYNKHVKGDQSLELQKSIESMVSTLSHYVSAQREGAKEFQDEMDKCHDDLTGVVANKHDFEQVDHFVDDLVSKSLAMKDKAKHYSNSLDSAQEEIRVLKAKLASSQQEALYDALTGLLNRRSFEQEVEALLAIPNTTMCLVMADIDHFKRFNDLHGHLLGDKVLKVVGKKLTHNGDNGAMAFRFGGEEFAILLPGVTLAQAYDYAEKIRHSIEKLVIKTKKTGELISSITCSFGVAEFSATSDINGLIALADERLYKAKKQGRNRTVKA